MKTLFRRIAFACVMVALTLTFAASAQEPVTLDLWIFEGEGEFLPAVVEAFQAEHPHITVQFTDIPESEYVTKIDTALLAGEVPDLGYIYERRWMASGAFLPLDDTFAAQNINLEDFNLGALSGCTFEDQVYCLGTYTGAVLLFYNKDMLDAAGIPYPSPSEPMTIDEYAAMAATLSIPNDDLSQRIWGSNISPTYWWMDARNFFSEDGRVAMDYFNDEATTHTHQVIADMIAQGSAISASDAAQFTGVDLISTGQLATAIIDNVIAIAQLETAGVRWGAAVVPVEKAGDAPWVAVWSDGLGVFSGSNTPDEAKLFATFLGTTGNQLRLDITGDLPLNLTLADDWAGDHEGRQEVLAAVQQARPALFIPDFWGVLDPINEAFDGLMMIDGFPAQDAFDEMAPTVQENLDDAWETWDQIQSAQ